MIKADKIHTPRPYSHSIAETVPFASAEDAWFWFIEAQRARNDGARIIAGAALLPRPCEPVDILNVVSRLYRTRCLIVDHMLVLRHYGRRLMAPDPRRIKEARASTLWREAFGHISPVLERKGIVRPEFPAASAPFQSQFNFQPEGAFVP